ncbi:sarcosine oxidase subunit gamma [Aquicoccus sp. SCR17]|nr:sarcosine oxidase subunit gamma [Carideicomes alvinocaridis]
MADLIAKTPCAGLLPFENGVATLWEPAPVPMTAIAPYRGRAEALSEALRAAHGLDWPGPGETSGEGAARLIWFDRAHGLLMGVAPAPALAEHAALTDQSDAWALVRLEGEGAAEVLARLTPLDLRESEFPVGRTARSLLGHMQGSITRLEPRVYQLMVFRSMAGTLVHELTTAMEQVAARG